MVTATDPVSAPAPVSVPASAPTALVPTAPQPGYKSSEAWFTFLAQLPALALNSGLVENAPLAAKLVSMAIAALTIIGYQVGRTSLKQAHLMLGAGVPIPIKTSKPTTIVLGIGGFVLAIAVAAYGVHEVQPSTSATSATSAPATASQTHAIRYNDTTGAPIPPVITPNPIPHPSGWPSSGHGSGGAQ